MGKWGQGWGRREGSSGSPHRSPASLCVCQTQLLHCFLWEAMPDSCGFRAPFLNRITLTPSTPRASGRLGQIPKLVQGRNPKCSYK